MESLNNNSHKHTVHHVLAHSYLLYFTLFLLGIFLDFIYNYKISEDIIMAPTGFAFLVFATIVILWAQKTGRDFSKTKELKTLEHFYRGPYCYTRIPTQWGLFLLMFGFGLVVNSFFISIFTIIAFLISRFIFIDKHDRILVEKYGEAYTQYKKIVKL